MFRATDASVSYRWRIAVLLSFGVLVNYIDRVNLSVAHDALHNAFGISDVTFGWLLSGYNFTYAACQLPAGFLLDRLGVRRVGAMSAVTVSIASFAAAAAPGTRALFGTRFLLGVGESPLFPGNAKAIGQWFPPRERSLATSLFDSAAKLASAIGVPLVGLLLLKVGWRWSFAATGFVTLFYFAAFLGIYKEPDGGVHAENSSPGDDEHISVRHLLRHPRTIGIATGMLAYNYSFYLLLTWLPTYLSRALHVDLLHSFLYTGVPWLTAALVDLLVGGWLVDALIARGAIASRLRFRIVVIGLICGLAILGAGSASTPRVALFWITISISGLSAASPVMWSMPSLIAPRASVATVGSFINFCGQLAAISAPIVTGYLVTATHSFKAAFAAAGFLLVLGIVAYLMLVKTIEPIRPKSKIGLQRV